MRRCNEPNPEHADAACVQPEGRHIDHLDGKGRLWSNAPVQEQIARAPKRRKGGGRGNSNASAEAIKRIQEAAASAQPERRVNPLADGRPFNGPGKAASMDAVETSAYSLDDRTTFFLAMAEVATRQETLTTNDAWDLLEARAWTRTQHANYVGVVGRMGASIGLWERIPGKILNTSGNGHSEDDGVVRYRSRVLGRDLDEIAPLVVEKASAGRLDSKEV